VNTKKAENSLQVILKSRQKNFGTFCRIAGKSSDLSLACQTQPMIDERLMSARAIINTPREDREGDIIVPRGVHLENFRKNPVVLWEHGLGEITRPIAKCQHPDGNLALEVEEHQISATSYFTDKSLESLQIFHLIVEGLVRATSVRAVPIKSSTRKTSNHGMGIVLEEWELIEWSWGALGVNPDAIARTIHRGTIEGHKITEPLLKSLKSVLSPVIKTVPGWTHPEENRSQKQVFNRTGQVEQPDDTSLEQMSNQVIPDKTVESENVKQSEPIPVAGRIKTQTKRKQRSGFTQKQAEKIPLGAQIIKSIQSSMTDLMAHINQTSVALENERVKLSLNTFLASLEKEQIALEKIFADNYAHLNDPGESEGINHEAGHADNLAAESSTGWLKSEMIRQLQTSDYFERLKLLSQADNLTLQQRQLLADLLKQINPTRHRQLACDEKKLERNVEELSQAVGELQQKLSDLLPA